MTRGRRVKYVILFRRQMVIFSCAYIRNIQLFRFIADNKILLSADCGITYHNYLTPKNGGTSGQAPGRRLGLSERMRHQFCPLCPVIIQVIGRSAVPNRHGLHQTSPLGGRNNEEDACLIRVQVFLHSLCASQLSRSHLTCRPQQTTRNVRRGGTVFSSH